ncbi:flagellar biosynthetic protein FliR [alpha proteobacterium Q-1]|nr:flagellar biosynthetic protein FliR [alpha proteobacterium Q-1]
MTLEALLSREIYILLLIFARTGTAFMFIPGYGESFVAARIRLLLALVFSWALMPLLSHGAPDLPDAPFILFQALFFEISIGAFLGLAGRMFITALVTAGQMISQMIGLSNIFVMPNVSMQLGSVVGAFLMLSGLVFIFASGLHLLSIDALARSYIGLPMGRIPDMDWISQNFVAVVAHSFRLAVELASPFLVLGFIYYLGLGLVNKAMQQLPVFFVSIPAAIAGGLFILILSVSAMLTLFRDSYADWLMRLTVL